MEVESYVAPAWSRDEVRAELGLTDVDFVLGTIARLAELKGHDDLLDGLGDLMTRRPELKLLWVGDGWWADRLLGRVRDMGLADRVVTTGLVPSEQIPKYLQAMDVLAHPSYREGLPRTVTQALLNGTAVVAYDVDGTREVCLDGETGRLVAPGDLTALREAVMWMMDHPGPRDEMGRRGQAMCRDRFDAARMVDHLEGIYAEVLAQSGSQAH